MRTEASLEEWKSLYEVSTRVKALEPWKQFSDMDIIGIRTGEEEENTVFYTILGQGGSCYGIAIYEGYEAFNSLLMLFMQEKLNLSVEYAMFHQRNLTCYWGNREELSDKQRKVIKDLGYQYRGKNQWLYFMSYEPGYYPYMTDHEEVLRMTEHLENLEIALHYYQSMDIHVDFEHGYMFSLVFAEDKKTWQYGEAPLPFIGFQPGVLEITDEALLKCLEKVPKSEMILEVEIASLGGAVSDKAYKKPANPDLCVLVEAKSGMILKCEMQPPESDAALSLAEELVDFIFHAGVPKEIRVSNAIVESVLRQICDTCQIKLRRVKQLPGVSEFLQQMKRFSS